MCDHGEIEVREYILEDGSSPYRKWFDSLDAHAAAKVTVAIKRLERGLVSAIKWLDGIGEYIIDWGPGYRIYLSQDGRNLIILYGGGTKKGQGADIREAKKLYLQYKIRKANVRDTANVKNKNVVQFKKQR